MSISFKRTARWCVGSVVLAAMLSLAGCGIFGGRKEKPPEPLVAQRSKEELRCPDFVMIGDTQDLVEFDSKGTTIDDLRYHISLEGIEGKCEYTHRNAGLTVSVKTTTTALLGPAIGKDEEVKVPFFVAIARPDGTIVTKNVQTVTFEHATKVDRRWLKEISLTLPDDIEGPELDILVGFQLTPAQLERNREYR